MSSFSFDRNLVLKILSYLNYKNAIRCRRLNKFFQSRITIPNHNDNDNENNADHADSYLPLFWRSYCLARQNQKPTKVSYVYVKWDTHEFGRASSSYPVIEQDLYNVRDHLLWRFRNNATLVSIKWNETEIHKASASVP